MNLMPPTSAFQHGALQQPPTPDPTQNNVVQSNTEVTNAANQQQTSGSQEPVESTKELKIHADSFMDMVENTSVDDQQHHKMNNNRLIQQPSQESDCDEDEDEEDSLMEPQGSLIEDSECTFGSPAGLRDRQDVIDEDDDTKEHESSALNHSPKLRNKRKNFKPRNIINKKYSPMDLSVQGASNGGCEADEDGDEDGDESDTNPVTSAGLSVVRPEVLFGQEAMMGAKMMLPPMSGPGAAIPPFLAPFLAASSASAPSIKDAFLEVLKLFGFPPELAEVFAKNAQALQQQQHQQEPDTVLTAPGLDRGK